MTTKEIGEKIKELNAKKPIEPLKKRYRSNDPTIEKLGEILRDNPKGMLVTRDELVGLLATWEKAGHEDDRTFYLEAWNGNVSFDTDRIARGSIFIPNLCVGIFGGIQPDKMRMLLEMMTSAFANDGMLQRISVLVYPDKIKWTWQNRSPDKTARDKVYDLLITLADFDPVTFGANAADEFNKIPYFNFSTAAEEVFKKWTTKLHTQILPNEENPYLAQHFAKYDKLFPALALVFHLVDCAAGHASGDVSEDAARLAENWCDYLESHARRCYGLVADSGQRSALTLSKKILAGKLEDGFTERDIKRQNWSHLKDDGEVQPALGLLEQNHWVRPVNTRSGSLGGRPTVTYKINPKLLKQPNMRS